MKDLKLIFSLMTGETYTVEADEVKNLDDRQLPLKKPFPANCTKCHGRGYIGHKCILTPEGAKAVDSFLYCMKCIRKCADK